MVVLISVNIMHQMLETFKQSEVYVKNLKKQKIAE